MCICPTISTDSLLIIEAFIFNTNYVNSAETLIILFDELSIHNPCFKTGNVIICKEHA